MNIKVDKNTTKEFYRIDHYEAKTPKNGYVYIKAIVNGKPVDAVTYFPDGWKGINWGTPKVKMNISNQEQNGDHWETVINISSDQFVRLCHLQLKKQAELTRDMPLPEIWFMDNYFDITKGQSKQVKVISTNKLKLKDIQLGHWLTQWE